MKTLFRKIVAYILRLECELVLAKYKPKIVAITGSVGKTSTKDAVYAVVSGVSYVRKSEKSYNSQIGLPLTILGCPNGWNNPLVWISNIFKGLWLFLWPHKYPKWLVLEVGVGKPGDMKATALWLKTDVVIITTIGSTPAHIEFFDSRKHLIEEKSTLIKTLKSDGVLILNNDDEAVREMSSKTKNRIVTFGFKEDSDIRGSEENIFYNKKGVPEGIVFRIDQNGSSLPVIVEGVFGRNHIYASFGALALAHALKWNIVDAVDRLKDYSVPVGRMRLLKGINKSFIIDDTYNSSPFACESALRTLGEIKTTGRKIAVLGDMLELGKHTEESHRDMGKVAKENVNILVVVGPRAQKIKEGALDRGMKNKNIFEFLNSTEAGKFLKTFVSEGDFVLIKGSQGVRMERAVEAILSPTNKKNKSKLLVRQDEEWLKKK